MSIVSNGLKALCLTSALCAVGGLSAHAQVKDEIIVTATKRAEKLTEVPIAISVFGANDIDQTGIRELKEISEFIPNVQISQHNDFRAVVTIRGVGSNSRNIGFDSRVGVYLDGVYLGQSPSLNQELLDLERVEVLRGPQGMLFGKNTVAGAISLVTKKPNLDERSGEISGSFGNFAYQEYKAMANMPIGEKAAIKASISKTDRKGYIHNIITGNDLDEKDVLAGRVQLRVQPSDIVDLNFSFDVLSSDGNILVGEPDTNLFGSGPVALAPERRVVALHFDPAENRDVYGFALDANFDLPNGFTLKSISGYRDTSAFYKNTTDYSPVSIIFIEYGDDFQQYSQEFQLISPGGKKLTYMGGLYFYKQNADTIRDVIFGDQFNEAFIAAIAGTPPGTPEPVLAGIAASLGFGGEGSKVFNRGSVETQSIAGYINGSYDFTDRFTVGAGIRYTSEDKHANWLLDGRNSGFFFIGSTGANPTNPSPLINDRSDDFLSVALSGSFAITDNSNVYAKYASGFKSGGFNLDYINANELAANSGLEFDKETVNSYEIGYKGNLMDGRLQLNMAAFIADYKDYQVNQFVDLGGGRTSIRITNAASVNTKGVEAEFKYQAMDNLSFQGSAGYLDATFDSFPGGGTAGADASGKDLVNAPKFTAALGAQYTHDIPNINGHMLLRADVTHSDGYFTTADNIKTTPLATGGSVPFGYIQALTQLSGRIGIETDDGGMGAYIWGRNLTDEDVFIDDFRDFFGTIVHHPNMPRTYGVEFVKRF
ncbi:MAG TPA: TonB-dependent receptor [Hellea balneolensis]|uniref:TonB-dependent receptor n=1 Tax=Hellea balneolensis TaxID=287478 RepID=A0A7C5R0D5_9PROT|nr:TonB-dependent receptor [Hellea balneolensis]